MVIFEDDNVPNVLDTDKRKITFLLMVHKNKGIIYKDIRSKLGISGPTYNGITDFMESIGAIRIEQDKGGLKIKKHFITKLGKEILLNLGEITKTEFERKIKEDIKPESSDKTDIEEDVFVYPYDLYRLAELIVIGEDANIITIPQHTMISEAAEAFAPSDPKTILKKSKQIDIVAQQYEVSFEKKDVSAMKIQLSGVRDIVTPILTHLKSDDFDMIYNKILYFLGEVTQP